MLKINKTADLDKHIKFKKKNNPQSWDDYDTSIKRTLKAHMLEKEQEDYCPYCERQIDVDNSHIEHIEPKHRASKFKEYNNMLTSCNNPNTCGEAKQGSFSDYFLNPVLVDPMKFLKYEFETGMITPLEENETHSNHQKARETIDILKLNERNLLQSRKRFNLIIGDMESYMDTQEIRNILEGYLKDRENFKTLIQYHLNTYS